MNTRLIDLWQRAMQNPALNADARQHIERVLNAEYITRQTAGTERRHDHARAA